jgi:hypothetical protein
MAQTAPGHRFRFINIQKALFNPFVTPLGAVEAENRVFAKPGSIGDAGATPQAHKLAVNNKFEIVATALFRVADIM